MTHFSISKSVSILTYMKVDFVARILDVDKKCFEICNSDREFILSGHGQVSRNYLVSCKNKMSGGTPLVTLIKIQQTSQHNCLLQQIPAMSHMKKHVYFNDPVVLATLVSINHLLYHIMSKFPKNSFNESLIYFTK